MRKHTLAVLFCWVISGCEFAVPSFDLIEAVEAESCLVNGGLATEEDLEQYHNSIVALANTGRTHGRCSGILIAPKLVLTAGHCSTPNDTEIRIGIDSRDPIERVRVTKAIRHPNYPDPDLAIWVLDSSPKLAKPWGVFADVEEGDILKVMGFGSARQDPENKGPLRTSTGVAIGFAEDDKVKLSYCDDTESEGGDSGSPIFNEEGKIVAILTNSVSTIRDGEKVQKFTLGPTTHDYLTWITEIIVEHGCN